MTAHAMSANFRIIRGSNATPQLIAKILALSFNALFALLVL